MSFSARASEGEAVRDTPIQTQTEGIAGPAPSDRGGRDAGGEGDCGGSMTRSAAIPGLEERKKYVYVCVCVCVCVYKYTHTLTHTHTHTHTRALSLALARSLARSLSLTHRNKSDWHASRVAPPPLSPRKAKEIETLLDEKLVLNEALARRQQVSLVVIKNGISGASIRYSWSSTRLSSGGKRKVSLARALCMCMCVRVCVWVCVYVCAWRKRERARCERERGRLRGAG
jgi:hypothetical protein